MKDISRGPTHIPRMPIEFPGEFTTRRAEMRDRGRILELMSERHPGYFPARYAWLYRSNPQGAATTWLALERSTGRLAGCTSIFPRALMVNGRAHRGAVGGDCYVRPSYRRRGVATLLHRATASGLADASVEMMFGPPNPANFGALIKSGARPVGSFGTWVRPLAAEACPLPHLLSRVGLSILNRMTGEPARGFRMELISVDDSSCPSFFEGICADYGVIGARNMSYVRWRYLDSVARVQRPFVVRREGRIVGFVVLETDRGRLHVVDFLTFSDPSVIDTTLALVVAHGKRLGCDAVEISTKSEGRLSRRLTRRGFVLRRKRGFQVLAAAGTSLPEAVLTPEAWHFLNGDEDLDTVARIRSPHEPSGTAKMAS